MPKRTKLILPNYPRKQHIIPAEYLEWFEDGRGVLWVYQAGQAARRSSAVNEATERDYFEVKVPGHETNFSFEKQLGRFEASAQPALKRLRRMESMSKAEHHLVAQYVVNLFFRSRQMRDRITVDTDPLANDFTDERKVREYQLGFCRETGRIVPAEEVAKALERVSRDFSDEALCHVAMVRRNSPPLVELLLTRQWHVVEPADDQIFLTSDAPVTSFQLRDNLLYPGFGWGREDTHVAIALTPRRLLILSPVGSRWDVHLDGVSTETINKLIASYAYRHVFASRCSEQIQNWVNENISNIKFGVNAYVDTSNGDHRAA